MRMLQFVLLVAALLFARMAAAQVYEFPHYDDAAQVRADCDRLLADLKQRERAIAALPERGGEVLAALDALEGPTESELAAGVIAAAAEAAAARRSRGASSEAAPSSRTAPPAEGFSLDAEWSEMT